MKNYDKELNDKLIFYLSFFHPYNPTTLKTFLYNVLCHIDSYNIKIKIIKKFVSKKIIEYREHRSKFNYIFGDNSKMTIEEQIKYNNKIELMAEQLLVLEFLHQKFIYICC